MNKNGFDWSYPKQGPDDLRPFSGPTVNGIPLDEWERRRKALEKKKELEKKEK